MKSMLLILGLLLAGTAHANPPATDMAPWTLPDQFDQPYRFDPADRVVLIAASNGAAKLVDEAIKAKPEGWLSDRRVVYIADISMIPRLIANRVLVPSMRSAKYRILLDREGVVASQYVEERSEVLWLDLDAGRIAERRQFADAAALRATLESLDTGNQPPEPAAE